MVKVANDIMSRGKQGYPALGLPIFDPLRIEHMNINQGNGGPVSIKINFKNFELRGLSDVRFTKISGFNKDFDRTKMQFNYIYPALSIQGPYKLDGKVLVLPVQGDGIANMTFCKLSFPTRRHLLSHRFLQTKTIRCLRFSRERSTSKARVIW